MGILSTEEAAKSIRDQVTHAFNEVDPCSACHRLEGYVINEVDWHQKRCGLNSRENLVRIHIVGGPGSGKTTLAREIRECLGTEVYELDQIAFTGRNYVERPISKRTADIYLIAHRSAWVTEGLFILWIDELLARANIIVWLDNVSWRRGFWRITHRFVRSAIREAKKREGLERFARFQDYARHMKQLVQVFFSSRAYYTRRRSSGQIESRVSTAAILELYKDKVIHCYDDEGVQAFIDYVRLCQQKHK